MIVIIVAVLLSVALTPVLKFFPNHANQPPRTGGLAVATSLLVAVVAVQGMQSFADLLPYWLGAGIVFGMGVVDDFAPLRPAVKLLFQMAAALVVLVMIGFEWLWMPLVFIWLVGVTNSLNLLDNMDGLTSGVGAIAAFGIAVVASVGTTDVILLALSGALIGFLVYNFSPAGIYLGDSGSHLVGFTLAAVALYSANIWVPSIILLAPIADTTFVTISRLKRGASPFKGGKDHLSHILVRRGFSERQVALLFYATTLVLVFLAANFATDFTD